MDGQEEFFGEYPAYAAEQAGLLAGSPAPADGTYVCTACSANPTHLRVKLQAGHPLPTCGRCGEATRWVQT